MVRRLKIYQIDTFTDKPFSGNPAAVTFANGLTSDDMQSIAKEMNLSETAFITRSDKADFKLQWFTPTTEVELCGHATIAALHFLKEKNTSLKRYPNGTEVVEFETLSGKIKCLADGNTYFMQIPVYDMEEFTECRQELITTLGIHPVMIDDKTPFILLSNKNVYIYIKELKDLQNIKPDFRLLKELSLNKNLVGIVVFTLETLEKNNFAHSRYFTPADGINEDLVTGSTNGPLLLVLRKLGFIKNSNKEISLTFEQGDVLGRRGRVGVTYYPDKNELYIHGTAVTVLKGELTF